MRTLECHRLRPFCSGMPLILSDWGGYPSFCLPDTPCSLVKVKSENFYSISNSSLIKNLIKYDQMKVSDEERATFSKMALDQFSLSSNVKRLRKIHDDKTVKTFTQWTLGGKKFARCFALRPESPFSAISILPLN